MFHVGAGRLHLWILSSVPAYWRKCIRGTDTLPHVCGNHSMDPRKQSITFLQFPDCSQSAFYTQLNPPQIESASPPPSSSSVGAYTRYAYLSTFESWNPSKALTPQLLCLAAGKITRPIWAWSPYSVKWYCLGWQPPRFPNSRLWAPFKICIPNLTPFYQLHRSRVLRSGLQIRGNTSIPLFYFHWFVTQGFLDIVLWKNGLMSHMLIISP